MKKILCGLLMLIFTVSLAPAQDTATQQQIDKLSGQIQELLEAQMQQGRKLDHLEREISELQEKVNTPKVEKDYALREDLKKLANQVQDLDQKRLDDRKVITEQISKLASLPTNVTPLPPHHSTSTPKPTENNESHDAPATPLSGYEYQVKSGDTLGLIVKAYRDKGVKVTKSKIIAANPKMNPEVLISGTKIFIPDPSAK